MLTGKNVRVVAALLAQQLARALEKSVTAIEPSKPKLQNSQVREHKFIHLPKLDIDSSSCSSAERFNRTFLCGT
jgi:hypothetical protein